MFAVVANVILYTCMHRPISIHNMYVQYMYICVHTWTQCCSLWQDVQDLTCVLVPHHSLQSVASQSRYKLLDKKRALDVDEDTCDDRSVCRYRWPYVRT